MRAGFSKIPINPEHAVELWGFANRQGVSAEHLDTIYAKTLILQHDSDIIALIVLDVGGVDKKFTDAIENILAEQFKINREHICLCATHTHSAPAVFPLRNAGTPDARYIDYLNQQLVANFESALANLRSVKIGYGCGHAVLGSNRREKGYQSDAQRDSGTIDPTFAVVRLDNMNGSPYVLLMNYAMHPVTLYGDNHYISADYLGILCNFIETTLGSEAVFLQGACGDINPKIHGSYECTKMIGNQLGEEAVRVAHQIITDEVSCVKMNHRRIKLPLAQPPNLSQLHAILQSLEEHREETDVWQKTQKEWAQELLLYHRAHGGFPKTVETELQCLQIDDIVFVMLPGEIFITTALKIKQKFPQKHVIVVGYANDCSMGYLPSAKAYEEGGYEVEEAFKYYGLFRYGKSAESILLRLLRLPEG